jgi:N-acetylglucosaminyldiphosphoundecaprenol N-acetyl-beta-D-mannosaminyltransferase
MQLLTYNITTHFTQLPLNDKIIVSTINPHSYCEAKKDEKFRQALQNSDWLLPDGIGIVWAARMINGQKIHKIAGFDVFLHLMKHLNVNNGACFFLGASQQTLALIKERCSKEFPNVVVNSYSPPYKTKFTYTDNKEMVSRVNNCSPDVLFVGMTAPKQEKWVYEYKDQLNARTICSIGAVFDFYAGTVTRPSQFWIKLGLEWLPRFLKEPRRLAQRNLVSTPKFIFEVFYYKLFDKGFL